MIYITGTWARVTELTNCIKTLRLKGNKVFFCCSKKQVTKAFVKISTQSYNYLIKIKMALIIVLFTPPGY